MIHYDDLVAALTAWRARQGLPVAAGAVPGSGPTAAPMTGSGPTPQHYGSGPTAMPGSGATAMPGSGPVAKPGSGPQRATPPMAPPDTADDSLDVDDEALLEETHYENEGADFAMNFAGAVEKDEESTTLGHAPERDSFGGETDFDPKSRKPW